MNSLRLLVVVALVTLVGGAAVAAGTGGSGDARPETEVRFVDEEFVVADGVLLVSDTTLRGPGLGEHHVEDRTYTVDSTVRFDGFHVTRGDTLYTVCRVTVHVEDVGVRFQNVTLTEGGADSGEACDC